MAGGDAAVGDRPRRPAELLWETDALGVWNTAHATVPHLLAADRHAVVRGDRVRRGGARAVPPRGLLHGQARRHRPRPRAGRRPRRHRRDRLRGVAGLDRHPDAARDRRGSTASTSRSSSRAGGTAAPLRPDEVAAVVELGAPPAPSVHGSVLHADGGFAGVSARREHAAARASRVRLAADTAVCDDGAPWSAAPGGAAPASPRPARCSTTDRVVGRRRRLRAGGAAAARPGPGRPGLTGPTRRSPGRRRGRRRHGRRARSATGPPARPAARGPAARAAGRRRRRRLAGAAAHPRRGRRARRRAVCATPSAGGPAAARNTGLGRGAHRPRRVPGLRRRARARLARARCAGTSTTPPSGSSAPGSSAARPRRGRRLAVPLRGGPVLPRPRPAPASGAAARPGRLPAERRPAGPPAALGAPASTSRCRSPRTSTWSGGCTRPAGGCATSPRPSYATTTGPTLRPWLRRKAFYGTGAALLADRHGSDVAPLVLTPVDGRAHGGGAGPAPLVGPGRRRWCAPR